MILATLCGTGKRWDYQWKHSVEFVVPTVALHEVKRRGVYWRRQTFETADQFKGGRWQWIQPTKKPELTLRPFANILKKSSDLLGKSAKKKLSLYVFICKVGLWGGQEIRWIDCPALPLCRSGIAAATFAGGISRLNSGGFGSNQVPRMPQSPPGPCHRVGPESPKLWW